VSLKFYGTWNRRSVFDHQPAIRSRELEFGLLRGMHGNRCRRFFVLVINQRQIFNFAPPEKNPPAAFGLSA